MEISEEKLKEVKARAKIFYNQLDKIYCPYLARQINFNEEGFGHLLSKSWNKGRSSVEQYTRLRILPRVVEIIKLSHTLQEFDERELVVRQKINSRWEKRMKKVRYYVFIALLKEHNFRIKIVIKEIEGGQPFFWSVYPSWRVQKDTNGNKKKVFYFGNLEED
jgi:hypothetical protein